MIAKNSIFVYIFFSIVTASIITHSSDMRISSSLPPRLEGETHIVCHLEQIGLEILRICPIIVRI